MKIVHVAPFAPALAGIYEAARDMCVADMISGHTVGFVDAGGTFENGSVRPPQVGLKDDRGPIHIETADPLVINEADVIVLHTGCTDLWQARTQAPSVVVIHGRPLAAFRSEQRGDQGRSYQLVDEFANRWPRVKALVHFWPEFRPFWDHWIPPEKHVVFDHPPIDLVRFSPDGPIKIAGESPGAFTVERRGRLNGVICDSWRSDVDIFDVANGAIAAARRVPGLKWHFFAMESGVTPGRVADCWRLILKRLEDMGALGEVQSRFPRMDEVYRGADFVLTPHRIITRVIGEAICCGRPVVAANGCRVTPYTADPSIPESVADAVVRLANDFERLGHDAITRDCIEVAERCFDLRQFGNKMSLLYSRITSRQPIGDLS